MDRKEKLKESYDLIFTKIDSVTIAKIVLNDIEDIEKVKQNLDVHCEEVCECYDKYLELIPDPSQKHIALSRLKSDFERYGDEAERLFSWQQHSSSERAPTMIFGHPVDIDVESWIKICLEVQMFFYILSFECANEDSASLESELIGATAAPRKSKPTKEQKLALNQNELMYLFMKLGAKDIFTKKDKTHLARGIEELSGFSANKTREKGTNLKLAELENIKTMLDDVFVSLNADITQSKAKTKK